MNILFAVLILAGQPSFAEEAYQTVGRRFTFMPLSGFSSEDGLGGGFRLAQFDYDGETIPYRRALSLQAFVTTKGKWAHILSADFPQVSPGRRLEISIRYDKEETANFFGDLTDEDLETYTKDERTFQQSDVYLTIRWVRALRDPWRLQIRLRAGSTFIDPHTPNRNVIDMIAPLGHEGGHLAQLGASVRHDTRDDYVNSKRGHLEEIGIEWGVGDRGNFNGGEIVFQHRRFLPLSDRWILANRLFSTYTVGDVPFYEQPQLGSSRTLRGLSADRLRDDTRVLFNTELRWLGVHLSQRHQMFGGLNGFVDVGQVFPRRSWPSVRDWEVGYGLGIRIYWYSTVVRSDYARSGEDSALYMRFSQIF